MTKTGEYIKNARIGEGLKIREVSSLSGIDQALISKYESGDRLPTEEQLLRLVEILHLQEQEARIYWLADKVVRIVLYDPLALDALEIAERRVKYLKKSALKPEVKIDESLLRKLEELDVLKARWQESQPLNSTQFEKLEEYFNTEYTYESNRIEGNTLTHQEKDLVVNKGLTIGGKSMREHLEAINHAHALEFIKEIINKEIFSKRALLQLHALILKSIDQPNAGIYRQVQVMISGSVHVPPQPYLVPKMMEEYFAYYNLNKSHLHPVLLAAEMHERLVSIHPFIDGNGRTSRLVMNMILLQNGYTIANLKGDTESRLRYYNALEKVQVDNAPQYFHELIIDAVMTSLNRHLELV